MRKPDDLIEKYPAIAEITAKWNKSMAGAFKRGVRAFLSGEGKNTCPYRDIRKPSGGLSWSRAFSTCWHSGWDFAYNEACKQVA